MRALFVTFCSFLAGFVLVLPMSVQGAAAVETLWTFSWPAGHFAGSPAIGDVNGDGRVDIAVAATDGHVIVLDADGQILWRKQIRGAITIPPTLVDIVGNPAPGVVVVNEFGQIHCFDGVEGILLWDWSLPGRVDWGLTSIVAADIDNDGALEIITGDSTGAVACLRDDGEESWLYKGSHGHTLCPAVGDLDGDGVQEILVGGVETALVCISNEGKELWRVEQDARGSSPVVWDLDGDGQQEILVGVDNKLAAVDAKG
ncbi:MAG: PQQ-binding-like beta-propeller repeat protein, partial [bacterium]